jgi:hypothetical protein
MRSSPERAACVDLAKAAGARSVAGLRARVCTLFTSEGKESQDPVGAPLATARHTPRGP